MLKKNLLTKRINILNHILIELVFYLILNLILYENIYFKFINLYNIILWIFISYIFDRYHFLSFKIKYIKSYIFKTFIIYLMLYVINSFFNLDNSLLLIFSLFSIITQLFYMRICEKIRKGYKKWLTNDNDLMDIFNSNRFDFKNNKLYFFDINTKYDLLEFDGFILDKNLRNYKYLKDIYKTNKLKIFTSLDWCEFFIEALPLNIIKNNEFYENLKNQNQKNVSYYLKRIFEFIFSLLILILLFPIILIFLILVLFQDGFPLFYSQLRKGKNNKINKIFKIRSMKKDSEINGPQWSPFNDSRITFIGKFMRKNRIDELPQLLSVILGEMSLIGPRPERPEIDDFLKKEIDFYDYRYLVKPGITGWAQVNYPYGASIEDSKIKQSFDLYYVKNVSIILDLIIFLKTIRLILNGRGSIPLEKK